MYEISKRDWKLFRERVPEWQEHYMEQLIKEYIELLSAPGNASDHFWELEKRIKKDKKHPGVIIELSKSDAIWDIAFYVRDKVITMDDLEGFSENLIDAVKLILSR
ncbi:MAG: multidrug transporter [Lachnospiraceae bacterium]|nr:multidrug transporter [Lachnospiraceae bacterium]